MKTKITEADWLKLRDYNRQITKRIMAKLPADWYLTSEDVEGAVYDSIISLLSTYKGGSMSPTSYCYQYAEKYTMRDLLREYERLKRQVAITDENGEEGETVRHEIGTGEVEELTVDGREELAAHFDRLDARAKATQIMEGATETDRRIMQGIMQGETLREIAEDLGISKDAVKKRLRKYGKN